MEEKINFVFNDKSSVFEDDNKVKIKFIFFLYIGYYVFVNYSFFFD